MNEKFGEVEGRIEAVESKVENMKSIFEGTGGTI